MDIQWHLNAEQIEKESFRLIEQEAESEWQRFPPEEWRVIRRLVHTTADFSLINAISFHHNPVKNGLLALRQGVHIYCDTNMVRSGLSLKKLQRLSPKYTKEMICCHIADKDVTHTAATQKMTHAVAALEKAGTNLNGAIVLIGNAPLALARLAQKISVGSIKPSLVVAMPVGFVNVIESKNLIMQCDVPLIVLRGRRGGSPLAVASLHAIMETGFQEMA